MNQKFTPIVAKFVLASVAICNVFYLQAQTQTHKYSNSSEKLSYTISRQSDKGLDLKFSISEVTTEAKIIDTEVMQSISLSGVFLPNEAGAPDLPSFQRYIAIPQGATAVLKSVTFNTEKINNIDIAPAPVIPLDEIDKIGVPLVYKKDNNIYTKNALYPSSPVKLSTQKKIRGVDVVSIGIMPFQYNPVTKELIVYKDIQIEISFEGGNGHFGDDAYRSRWFDQILEDVIFNYDQLPSIDYNAVLQKAMSTRATGCEYAIIAPLGAVFSQWADSIRKFRTEQGILTEVYTFSDIGTNTVNDIETWVDNAYANWTIKPAAILILGDYGTDVNTTVISSLTPGFASDNQYSDVDGDDLPDIAFSRIVANNATQLQTMCTKFLNYERNPPVDAAFYDKPVSAVGWQDDRWYQLGVEIITGFMKTINKNPVRINNPSSPANNTGNNVAGAGDWSTTNEAALVTYFGPTGLNYIPDKPGTLGGFTGGTATGINTAINSGAFIAYHRDHGQYTGWYRPSYLSTNLNSLTNTNNKLPFVFSINCNTGEYQTGSACFVETFHRHTYNGQNSGALGAIAPSEVSYSFVNDVFMWGTFDNMWTSFMTYGSTPASRDMRPTFASVAGQYFLEQSSWVGSGSKVVTYQLYHTFAESFQWFYSEVPLNLTVVHNGFIPAGDTTYDVTANAGSFIAITTTSPSGPIILGTATGTGSPVTIPLVSSPTNPILVTVTKQNYFRYGQNASISTTSVPGDIAMNLTLSCYPNPFSQSATISYSLNKPGVVSLSVFDMLGQEVAVIMENTSKDKGSYQVVFSSENLAKGMYSCVLKTESGLVTRSLVID